MVYFSLFCNDLQLKINSQKHIMGKILGIGNALVDIMTQLPSDDFLKEFSLEKGSMQLVDRDLSERIDVASAHFEKSQSSGGSAANTIHAIAQLGMPCGYIGKVGKDALGEFFSHDMQENDITPHMLQSDTETGRAMALISKDSERTFGTYLGAAVELTPDDLHAEYFAGYDVLHIEGYLLFNNELLTHAAKLAKQHNLKLSLDMASFNVVEANLAFLKDYVENYVDIVFANEEEAKAFTGEEPRKALDIIAEMCEIAVVKVGKDGSWIKRGDEVLHVEATKANPVDTTGAGDLYAAGFLYEWLQGKSLERAGLTGTILAGQVIEVIGSKLSVDRWAKIKEQIAE